MKQKKYAKAYVREVGSEDGLLIAVIGSTAAIDRYGETIDQESWDLKHYKKNPVILWAHNLTMGEDRPPIGRAVKVKVQDGKLVFDIKFDMADPFAADIFRKYKEGFLNAFSVGFIPHTIQRNDEEGQPLDSTILKDNELLELSAVPVPANPEALNALRQRSFKTKTWDKLMKEVTEEDEEEQQEEKEEEKKTDKTEEEKEKALVEKVIEKLSPTLNQTITDVVSSAFKSVNEDKGGDNSAPKTPQVGGGSQKLARVMRETTKMLQGALAEYNQSLRK